MIDSDYNLKIIVLAAGKSERFDGIKLLATVQQQGDSTTLIQHVVQQISVALNILKIDEGNLSVATGGYHAQIARSIGKQFSLNYCQRARFGLGDTIAQSVDNIITNDENTSHVMITLADQVALTSDDYITLIKQSLLQPEQLICAQVAEEIMPHAIFPQQYFSQLMCLTGDKGAKILLYKNKKNCQEVLLANAAIDIDTQQDLVDWQKMNNFVQRAN